MVCEVETSEPTGFLLKSITTNHLCRSGGMVYTLVLGTSASQLVGSSPTFGTKYGVVAQQVEQRFETPCATWFDSRSHHKTNGK